MILHPCPKTYPWLQLTDPAAEWSEEISAHHLPPEPCGAGPHLSPVDAAEHLWLSCLGLHVPCSTVLSLEHPACS